MKNLFKTTYLLFCVLCVMSFSADDETSHLYIMALNKHLINIEKKIESQKEKKEFAYSTVFILNSCSAELPTKLNNHPIQVLADSSNNFISDNNLGLHIVKLNPIKVDGGNIVIILNDYITTKGSEKVMLSYVRSVKYTFNYYAPSRSYKIVRTQIISF